MHNFKNCILVLVNSDGSLASASLDATTSEQQLASSTDPLPPSGGTDTHVTASLTQPLMSDKLMWSPSTPSSIKPETSEYGVREIVLNVMSIDI